MGKEKKERKREKNDLKKKKKRSMKSLSVDRDTEKRKAKKEKKKLKALNAAKQLALQKSVAKNAKEEKKREKKERKKRSLMEATEGTATKKSKPATKVDDPALTVSQSETTGSSSNLQETVADSAAISLSETSSNVLNDVTIAGNDVDVLVHSEVVDKMRPSLNVMRKNQRITKLLVRQGVLRSLLKKTDITDDQRNEYSIELAGVGSAIMVSTNCLKNIIAYLLFVLY